MKTTVNLSEKLVRQAQAQAEDRGISLTEFVEQAMRYQLSFNPDKQSHRVQLPLVASEHPGSRDITNREIAEWLEEDDLRAASGH